VHSVSDPELSATSLGITARLSLKALGGWKIEGPLPTVPKAVVLAFPHTSNMDGLLLILLAESVGLHAHWLIKDAWGRPPMGAIIRKFGGIPIDRSKANGMVDQLVEEFRRADRMLLLIPPEGTRSRTDYWKSGFYRIAVGAKIPVIPGYMDFSRKRAGFGPPLEMTGDVKADMDRIRAYYGDDFAKMGRFPEDVGPIRLRDEDAPPGASA